MSGRDSIFHEHLQRLKAATLEGLTLASIPEWIEQNTKLRGQPFSFKDHEYQLQILRDTSVEKVVRKCSQVGISELAIREALAILNILQGSTLIYTMPTAADSKKFMKTRVDPIVRDSPLLMSSLNVTADNTEFKQFGSSYLHMKGTIGINASISTPADGIINDEVDFSDHDVMSTYQSRLTHSHYKLRRKFSTPTVEGYGISQEFRNSRRHFNFCKCDHCGHQFLPNYFDHVKVPGFDGDLREIRKDNLYQFRFKDAYLICPACGKRPSLQPEHREWVCENSDQWYTAAGYQIQPFDAPNVVTCSDLIVASTTYKRYVDFINFGLGLPAEDKETSFTRAELEGCYIQNVEAGFWYHVMGVDLGMLCHIVISGVDAHGRMMTVHTEQVPLPRLKQRMKDLWRDYRVRMTVMDSLPYTDIVMGLQAENPNLFGAIYVDSKDLLPFVIKKQEKEDEEGEAQVRQVNVNKNKAFDGLMNFVRSGFWQIKEDSNKETMISHLMDMKRVKDFTSANEMAYVWRKSSQGDDHFHHTLLYCWIASQMLGVTTGGFALPGFMHKFKVKPNVT